MENTKRIDFVNVTDVSQLNAQQLTGAIQTYQTAFELPPYQESFTDGEVIEAFESILKNNGDLLFGQENNEVICLAGGYMKEVGVYYIEELAVRPDSQGKGVGRATLRQLVKQSLTSSPEALEIRTTIKNEKALRLYRSEGFVEEPTTEVVSQRRSDGGIALDERVYLRKQIGTKKLGDSEMLRRVAVAYPSGNTTGVVFDQLLGSDRETLNSRVMEMWKQNYPEQPEIEQCCFVTMPLGSVAIARVEMFGGEFCGNATRSAIQLITDGKYYSGAIEVSGAAKPLSFEVAGKNIRLEMPIPESESITSKVKEGVLVQLDGIAQLVVDASKLSESPRELLEQLLTNNSYRLREQPAVGVTSYDSASGKATFAVWVKEVNTVFDETACGSGTSAIGIASAAQKKSDQRLEVIQPSGESIFTTASFSRQQDRVVRSEITGTVDILYDGSMELS